MNTMEMERLVQEITDEVLSVMTSQCPSGASCRACNGSHHCVSERTGDVDTLISLGASRIGTGLGLAKVRVDLASYIDHTLLSADATPDKVEKLCQEAVEHKFFCVCINSSYVKYAADLVAGSGVKVCSVVGFPLGAMASAAKAYESQVAEYNGAHEIDMVIHIGALKSKGYDYVESDIAAVVKAVSPNTLVKVILETASLTDEEKVTACKLSQKARAHYVKTSTGFGQGGATAADIALMRKIVGESMGVKASGGVRDRKTAELMIQAGASRIGASASVRIVSE